MKYNEQIGGQNSFQENRMSESSQSVEMSSDMNLVSKCISKNSHSFDDRVCDDLSEVLLQFLPLDDKQRLECVSKQFQRTVFQKQFSITLYSSLQSNYKISKQTEDKVFDRNFMKSIEFLLKKCPNIQTMFLNVKNNNILKSLFPLITKYCDHLNEFNVYLDDWKGVELNEEFYRKFGSKLHYIGFGENWRQNLDFNLFPNLHSNRKKFYFSTISPERALRLNLKKLKELDIDICEENQHLFREVLQKFHKIRYLSLKERHANLNTVFNAFQESPVLQNLIQLKYYSDFYTEIAKQFLDLLKRLPKKLPKLKSIVIKSVFAENISDFRRQLSPLKAFPDLKRLTLFLMFLDENYYDEFSFESLEGLSNITHFTLYFEFDKETLSGKILTDIDIYLPKLQYLSIYPQINTDEEGVTQMAESLSKLSRLHTIELWLNYVTICDKNLLRVKIIEKCKKIIYIGF